MAESIVFNMDCMEYLRTVPDKHFDLAVVDPPYGYGTRERERTRFGGIFDRYKKAGGTNSTETENLRGGYQSRGPMGGEVRKKIIAWDIAPDKEYFDELFRVSRNQIIWGGNYFGLPPARNFIVWDKVNITEDFSMAMCEYAWCSIPGNAKIIRIPPQGSCTGVNRFHPTQKQQKLYEWIFARYAKPGDKILDTHLGSGVSRIAALEADLDFVGIELDEDYFRAHEQMFHDYMAQESLFR